MSVNMDNFNKILSFVLGLVVVIVFLAVITGRFDVKKRFQGFGTTLSPTPTRMPTQTAKNLLSPVPTAMITSQPYSNINKNTNNTIVATKPTTIPATGSPTLLLPLLASSLGLGIYFKKKS